LRQVPVALGIRGPHAQLQSVTSPEAKLAMTASKSSRARNARTGAQVGAAKGGTAVKNGNAARSGTAKSAGTATRDRNARDQARNGAAARGPRAIEVSDAPAERGPAPWLQITTFVLALAGLGVSIYLTIAHFTESALAGCSESGLVNCTKVTTSAESYVFGIPVAVLGLAFFVFGVVIMSPWAWRATRREIHLARIASLVVGMGFVLYLLYAELFTIGSICLYCTSVHVITFLLFVLTVFAAAAWGLKPGAPWKLVPERQPE
jgi:uncharacterized membrane protein